jgi:serine/threonine-protein kinase
MAHVQDVLAGRYELLDVLGRGGMGVVYRATDRVLARPVAIKVLPVERAEDPSLVARFEREALAAAALSHPNVVAVYDSGCDEDTRFIVMECVPGENLAQLLRRRGPLPPREAVNIGAQVAAAMAAAHRAGLIHRDIKPANVMADGNGRVKVLDFGIVRSLAGTTLTQTANVIGSAPYLAPEVAQGRPADERSDVYSLGCVLYEMLTGRPPFSGELPAAVMHQHNTAAPRPPRELNPDVPPALAGLVLAMLAKRPSQRPGDAELAQALGPLTADGNGAPRAGVRAPLTAPTGVTAPLLAPTAAEAPLVAPPAPVVHDPTPLTDATRVLAGAGRELRRRPAAALAAGLAGVLVMVLVALALAGGSGSPQNHRSAAPPVRSTPTRPATASTPARSSTTPARSTTAPTSSARTHTAQSATTSAPPPAQMPASEAEGHGKGHGNGASPSAKDKGTGNGKGNGD